MDTKKFIIICASILGGFLLLLLIVWLISLTRPKYITYEELEKKMVSASKNYVKDNENKFTTDNAKYNLGYQTLVAGEYIKPLEELLENPSNCTASTTISKNGGEYSYVPYLNCGDRYRTIELYRQILNDNQLVSSGSGLYRTNNGGYYFRGKNLNNYVAFGTVRKNSNVNDYIWQIMSIGSDNTVKLRATFNENFIRTKWDDRYNENTSKFVGYNLFDDSLLQEKLEELYNDRDFLNTELKSKLVSRHLCVAPRSGTDESQDGSTECSQLSKKAYYFSTITPYEFMRISIDPNCKNIYDRSCSNFNFISQNNQSTEWIMTATPDDNSKAYIFDGKIFDVSTTKYNRNLYVVIELNEYSFYKSGDGSLENPYRLKLSNELSGEDNKNKDN